MIVAHRASYSRCVRLEATLPDHVINDTAGESKRKKRARRKPGSEVGNFIWGSKGKALSVAKPKQEREQALADFEAFCYTHGTREQTAAACSTWASWHRTWFNNRAVHPSTPSKLMAIASLLPVERMVLPEGVSRFMATSSTAFGTTCCPCAFNLIDSSEWWKQRFLYACVTFSRRAFATYRRITADS